MAEQVLLHKKKKKSQTGGKHARLQRTADRLTFPQPSSKRLCRLHLTLVTKQRPPAKAVRINLRGPVSKEKRDTVRQLERITSSHTSIAAAFKVFKHFTDEH